MEKQLIRVWGHSPARYGPSAGVVCDFSKTLSFTNASLHLYFTESL